MRWAQGIKGSARVRLLALSLAALEEQVGGSAPWPGCQLNIGAGRLGGGGALRQAPLA